MRIKSFKEQDFRNFKSFLVVDEKDFEGAFKHHVIKGQKLSNFNEEIDYDSDRELIAKN